MIYAKKSLGQHFLKSEKALESIVRAGELSEGDAVLEIGPGTGNLTERLLETGAKVIAVEKDDDLNKLLREKFATEIENQKLTLIHEDILNLDLKSLPSQYKLIANIPYNITGAILEKFLSSEHQPTLMVLLLQKEVAKRITDPEKESILSLSVKAYGTPHYIEKVLAGSFSPAPKVDSAIIAISNISKNFFQNFSEETFFKIVKAGFQAKRKRLSSNLARSETKERVGEVFKKLQLDENTRAEEVPIETWGEIAKSL